MGWPPTYMFRPSQFVERANKGLRLRLSKRTHFLPFTAPFNLPNTCRSFRSSQPSAGQFLLAATYGVVAAAVPTAAYRP